MSSSQSSPPRAASHQARIQDQFTRQAEIFANSAALHDRAALDLLVEAGRPQPEDESLDVACGPGSVVAAFAPHVQRAWGLDATERMLVEARKLAASQGLANVAWRRADARRLPFDDARFNVVSCRFAVHHLEDPPAVLSEMVRVCRPGGRIVVCDAFVSDDPAKAEAFNRMERLRDPSTIEFRTLAYLAGLFPQAGLPQPDAAFYKVPVELERLMAASFPDGGDRQAVARLIEDTVTGDKMGVNARREGSTVRFEYPAVILASTKC